jgi:hypothetical protein
LSIDALEIDGTKIIECIEHDIETLEESQIEFWILDICVTRFEFHIRIEFLCNFFRDLDQPEQK